MTAEDGGMTALKALKVLHIRQVDLQKLLDSDQYVKVSVFVFIT